MTTETDDPGSDWSEADITSERLVRLYDTTLPQLAALIAAITPLAHKRPAEPAAAAVVADARTLLAEVARIVSREPRLRGRLLLAPSPDWASLGAKLALARAALAQFQSRYRGFDPATLTGYWRAQ